MHTGRTHFQVTGYVSAVSGHPAPGSVLQRSPQTVTGVTADCLLTLPTLLPATPDATLRQEGSVGPSGIQAGSPVDPDAPGPGRAASAGQPDPACPGVAIHESVSTESQYLSTGNGCVCTMEAPTGFFSLSSVISLRVVSKPRSNLVLRKPLKMSQEGQKPQTVGAGRQWLRKRRHGPQGPVIRPLCGQSAADLLRWLSWASRGRQY